MILAALGVIIVALKKDKFVLLWVIPNLLFFLLVEWQWASERVFIPLIPLLCIVGAITVESIVVRVLRGVGHKWSDWAIITAVVIFGLGSTIMLITTNVTEAQFQTASYASRYLEQGNIKNETLTVVSPTIYSWIFKYIFNKDHVLNEYFDVNSYSTKTDETLLIADEHFKKESESNKRFGSIYNNALIVGKFKGEKMNFDDRQYPYTSMSLNEDGFHEIEIGIVNNSGTLVRDCIKRFSSVIKVSCESANLMDVYNSLDTSNILTKLSSKTWLLNGSLQIENSSTFYINSTDTNWLKINSEKVPYSIKAHGNLVIDSVKITGWNSSSDDYAKTDKNGTIPRAYILAENGEGRINISNSEVAYLGFDFPSGFGLTYVTGSGSSIRNNKIHDLYYGFYSDDDNQGIVIDSNKFYNNTIYGIDLHSGTHDLTIKNNEVMNNGKHGIICSTNCHEIIIDSNIVYNNKAEGIMLHKDVSTTVVENNLVINNRDQIAIYDNSNHNRIYNNTLIGGNAAVRVTSNSSWNLIHNNKISSSVYGIYLLEGASENQIESNKITNTLNPILVQDIGTYNNHFRDNILVNNQNNGTGNPQ